jgi:hypothetical protein
MSRLVRSVLLILVTVAAVWAQDLATVELQAERLRAQLREVVDKEAGLRARVEQIDEELRPENIERSVATTGTTDARSLRDERRQRLEREKASVEEQLRSLAASRASLEASIASVEAEAVRLRAAALAPRNTPQANAASTPAPAASRKRQKTRRAGKQTRRRRARRRAP